MPKTRPPYAPEFRQQMVELVRAGRDPQDLPREFEPSDQAIRNWVVEADRRDGRREPKPTVVEAALAANERDELLRLRRENKQLRLERDILSRAVPGTHRTCAMGPVPGWRGRPARCRRALRLHEREPGQLSRVGACHRGSGPTTTQRDEDARPAPDLVDRTFKAQAPDQLWVADITYVPTMSGFLHLAVVPDVFSRRIVGWSMQNHLRTELIVNALDMAVSQRRPKHVIHHSDQGCQCTSLAFGSRCKEAGVRPSMGSVGDAYDDAMAESFFSTLECELLSRRPFTSQAQASMACFTYIEGFYNPHHLHSGLGYRSPVDDETCYHRDQAAALIPQITQVHRPSSNQGNPSASGLAQREEFAAIAAPAGPGSENAALGPALAVLFDLSDAFSDDEQG